MKKNNFDLYIAKLYKLKFLKVIIDFLYAIIIYLKDEYNTPKLKTYLKYFQTQYMIIYRFIDFGSNMNQIKPKRYNIINDEDYIEIKDSLEYEISNILLTDYDSKILNYIKNLP